MPQSGKLSGGISSGVLLGCGVGLVGRYVGRAVGTAVGVLSRAAAEKTWLYALKYEYALEVLLMPAVTSEGRKPVKKAAWAEELCRAESTAAEAEAVV
jgi:hypothetical protein